MALLNKNDFIYVFSNVNFVGGRNQYQKYSPNLDLLVNDHFNKTNSFGYSFDINDAAFHSGNNLIMAGSVGNYMGWIHGMFTWYALAVTKVGTVNSNPVFLNKNIAKKVLPGDSIIVSSPAIDYENDPVSFEILTPYNWLESGELPYEYLISPAISDTGNYEVILKVSDNAGGSDTTIILISIGNNPPVFTSTPITKAVLNSNYVYKLTAGDPDDKTVHFKITEGPAWLELDSTGLLSGRPVQQSDTGFFQVSIVCYDDYSGEGIQRFSLHVVSDIPTGINDVDQEDNDILVYPVPASNMIYLKLNHGIFNKTRIKIVNFNGTLIRDYQVSQDYNNEDIELDINGIDKGIYLLIINLDSGLIKKKIIIL